jgi:hypothetical protein
MSASTVTPITSVGAPTSSAAALSASTCGCGAGLSSPERARRLLQLDRAVDAGLVTRAEAAERRVQLLAR